MIAVYSLWNKGDRNNTASFNSVDDLMAMMKLSAIQSKKFFERVILVTDSIGAERVHRLDIPFDEVRIEFDQLAFDKRFWAVPKLMAMKSVNEPEMMHIDNDFVWWQDPAIFWKGEDLLFQNTEPYRNYPYYDRAIRHFKENFPGFHKYADKTDFAYNCGVTGVRRPEVAAVLCDRAMEVVNTRSVFEGMDTDIAFQICLLIEQSFYASYAVEANLSVKCLLNHMGERTTAITHLLGHTKRRPATMNAIHHRLQMIEQPRRTGHLKKVI